MDVQDPPNASPVADIAERIRARQAEQEAAGKPGDVPTILSTLAKLTAAARRGELEFLAVIAAPKNGGALTTSVVGDTVNLAIIGAASVMQDVLMQGFHATHMTPLSVTPGAPPANDREPGEPA